MDLLKYIKGIFGTDEEKQQQEDFYKWMVENNRSVNYYGITSPLTDKFAKQIGVSKEALEKVRETELNKQRLALTKVPRGILDAINPDFELAQTPIEGAYGLTRGQMDSFATAKTMKDSPAVYVDPDTLNQGQEFFNSVWDHEGKHTKIHEKNPFMGVGDYTRQYFDVPATENTRNLNIFWNMNKGPQHMRNVYKDFTDRDPLMPYNEGAAYDPASIPNIYEELSVRAFFNKDGTRKELNEEGLPVLDWIKNKSDRQAFENFLREKYNIWPDEVQ